MKVNRNDVEEQVLFIAKNLTLEKVTITLCSNAIELPVYFHMLSGYIIDDAGAKCVALNN
jgi:hypothetical protein